MGIPMETSRMVMGELENVPDVRVTDFIVPFTAELWSQLLEDERRWGSEWLKRTREGQEYRIWNRISEYYSEFEEGGVPMPWLKIAGNAMIAWIRTKALDLFPK